MNNVAAKELIFSVSELNQFIRDVVTSGLPRAVWVCGEIQGLRTDQKGHMYFEICEKDEDDHTIKARIRASIWNTRRPYIESVLKRSENAIELKNEIEVKLLCKADFYVKGGSLSLTVESIDPVYTLGRIAQERQKLIAQLKKEGLLEKNKTLQVPLVPLNVGLITSEDSAAFNDFKNELLLSGYGFKIFLHGAMVQGKQAESSVSRAVKALNKIPELDVIVISRGGGSVAELSCFDSRMIVEAVANSSIPVLTGIGHEINMTITDLAAHTYAKTPTAIAQFLVARVENFLTQMNDQQERVVRAAVEEVTRQKHKLRASGMNLQTRTNVFFKIHHNQLARYAENIASRPAALLKGYEKDLFRSRDVLVKAAQARLSNSRLKIVSLQKIIEMASPINTLKRGFTISRCEDGTVLKSVSGIKKGEKLSTEFMDGKVISEIHTINKEK